MKSLRVVFVNPRAERRETVQQLLVLHAPPEPSPVVSPSPAVHRLALAVEL